MHSPRPREDLNHLDVAVTPKASVIRVQLCGEVDLSNRDALLCELAAVCLEDVDTLHLDLHELTFCDIQGCHLLGMFLARAQISGVEVRIHDARPVVRRVLTLLGHDNGPTFG